MPKLRYYHDGEWHDLGSGTNETRDIRGALGITHWEELDGSGIPEGDVQPGIIGERLYFQDYLRIPEFPDTPYFEITQNGDSSDAWMSTELDAVSGQGFNLHVCRLSIEWEDTEDTPRFLGTTLDGDPVSFGQNLVQGHTGSAVSAGRRTLDTSSHLLPQRVIGASFIAPWCGVYDPGGPNHQISQTWTQFEIIDLGPCENMYPVWFS